MAETPHKDSTWLGIPMKHVSLVTVRHLPASLFHPDMY